MSSASGLKVFNESVVMQSFSATIDSPAVFSGVTSTGYELVTRGAETAVTVDTQIKYDGNTKGFINSFDTQTAPLSGNMFVMTNNNAYGIDVQNGVFTNVAYAEADIMMLDCSIKAIDDGTDPLITFDITS
jgi:16S rRNA G966 N2-methylase RsmD